MGIAVKFSSEDMARGELLDVDWYTVQIDDVQEGISKKGNSTNYTLLGTILRNGTTGDTKYQGRKLGGTPPSINLAYWGFNSQVMNPMIGLFKAVGVDKVEADKAYDLEALKGKVVDVFVERGEYNGSDTNAINHKYRAVKS